MTTKAPGKQQQVSKAQKVSRSTKKGVIRRKYRVRTNLRFYKPSTLKLASKPKYQRSTASLKLPAKLDKFSVLVQPLNTEKANKAMTERNTLTFLIHNRSNKVQIKRAFKDIFGVVPSSVNTLVRPDGKKKAFIRLRPEDEAVSIASKIGII
jgi:large subunit ribosomal protein L23Ae